MNRVLFAIFLAGIMITLGLTTLTAASVDDVVDKPSGLFNQSDEQHAHYIVFQKQADGIITPLYYRQVQLAAPLKSLESSQLMHLLAQPDRNDKQLAISLQTKSGEAVYQSLVQIPQWLRGEFHGSTPENEIEGHFFPLESAVFVVRIPVIPDSTLVFHDQQMKATEHFDLAQLIINTPHIDLKEGSLEQAAVQNGNPANRVDFLIMGDGYTAVQSNDFTTDANAVATQFFNISPYAEYANYVNTTTLFTPSNQSGSDHPPYDAACGWNDNSCCADATMLSDPLQGTLVDTAFDSTFCRSNIHRLLVPGDYGAIYAAAAAVPDWDQIMLLVNDTTYGGSGGSISTISMHGSAVQVAQHEYGHVFADLADEYTSPYPGYPACSDSGGSACESNVTDETVRAQIKWNPWIDALTPIPTGSGNAGDVGLFEGARYQSSGMYRSGYSCIMRSLGAPYCDVPSQSYVLKLYEGGWGNPGSGISLIEPGTTSPADTGTALAHPAVQLFHADILSPTGGAAAQISWMVNNVPIVGATDATYAFSTNANGLGQMAVSLLVTDTTTLVHPAMANNSLQFMHTWDILVTGLIDAGIALNGTEPLLSWNDVFVNVDALTIYRHTSPYFTPDPGNLITTLNDTSITTFADPASNMLEPDFYLIQAKLADDTLIAISNEVGEFPFVIVPGS